MMPTAERLSEKGSDPLTYRGISIQSGEFAPDWARGLTPFRIASESPAPSPSRRPRQRPHFAELARQFLPRRAAVGGTIDLATDAAGINEVRIRGMDGEDPHRAIGASRH